MKCCSRSTTWRASALVLLCAWATVSPSAEPLAADETAVRLAIIAAVQAKMGPQALVSLDAVTLSVPAGYLPGSLAARPEPGSRTSRPIRFTLSAQGTPAGSATAVVHVAVPHARTTTVVRRGEALDDTNLAVASGDVGIVLLTPLPVLSDLRGTRVVRDLRPGEIVTAALVRVPPLVTAGDIVRVTVRLGRVEASGMAVAQQSGRRHDRIRLINPESRRTLIGRVTAPGHVEVIHVL